MKKTKLVSSKFKNNRILLFKVFCVEIILMLFLTGCNYVIEGSNPVPPNEAKTMAILPIQNQTFIAGLETDLSEQLHLLLSSNSSLKIVPAGIADLHLSIYLLKYETNSSGLTKEQISTGVKATVEGKVILLDRRINKKIWVDSKLEVKLTESLENEMENVSSISLSGSTREIIKLFAKKIYDRIFTTF